MRFVACALVLALGCHDEVASRPEPQAKSQAEAHPAESQPDAPITDEEAAIVAKAVIALAHPACDQPRLGELIDQPGFTARFASHAGDNPVAVGAASLALQMRGSAEKVLCTWISPSEQLKLMRVVDGQPILRRLMKVQRTGAVGATYIRLLLVRSSDHEIRIADAYSYFQGVWLTEALGEFVASQAGGRPDKVFATVDKIRSARDLQVAGKHSEALAVLDTLPPSVRTSRGVLMMRIGIAQPISSEAYLAALDELARTFPDDASTALAEIDGALLHKDYAAALRYLDTFDKEVGQDSFQAAIRALVLTRRNEPGDLDRALAVLDNAITIEPTLGKPWYVRLDVQLARKDWTGALAVMDHLTSAFGTQFTDEMLAKPAFAGLVASPEFARWRKTRIH